MDGLDGSSRRAVLLAAGGALSVGAVDSTGQSGPGSGSRTETSSAPQDTAETDGRDDFLWLSAGLWRDPALREQLLAFARRRDLCLALGQPPTNAPGVGETIRPALADASAAGVETWVNVGAFQSATASSFRTDDAVRERHLAGLREVARELDRQDAGETVICWQEAPVMGQWTEGGEWTQASVEALRTHGPAVFAAQKRALQDANPALDVGLFVHFPYVVDSKRPRVFAELAADLRDDGTTPDFGFTDFYRGWYEKDAGPDAADAAVRSLVENAREHLGTDVYYLGQAHTISPGHTPSRQALRSNLRTALDAGAAAVGWYAASTYRATTSGFDPFVPNAAGAAFDGGPVCTPTVALDRYRDAWAATLVSRPGVEPADRFDLWLHGDGIDHWNHRVLARTGGGDWRFLGSVGGYLDGEYPYAGGRTAVLGAIERERFFDAGTLDLRIETADGATTSTLAVAIAMPWDPAAPTTERLATELIAGDADVAAHELGRASPQTRLVPGEARRLSIPVDAGAASLTRLFHPSHVRAINSLAAAEEQTGFEPADRFDLWVLGEGPGGPGAALTLRDQTNRAVDPDTAAVVSVSNGTVALSYGLERDRLLADGLVLDSGVADSGRVEAAYAMPYAGSACFRSPEQAATLLREQPQEAQTFAIDSITEERE